MSFDTFRHVAEKRAENEEKPTMKMSLLEWSTVISGLYILYKNPKQ